MRLTKNPWKGPVPEPHVGQLLPTLQDDIHHNCFPQIVLPPFHMPGAGNLFFLGAGGVSLLFGAVDRKVRDKYVKAYQEALPTGALRIMTATNRACFQGLVVIRNLAAQPHKDTSDYKKGWVTMCCFGEFTSGELVIPVLKMRFQFQPGDVIFFRSTLLEHYVLPFMGNRTSLVFFTHHNVMN